MLKEGCPHGEHASLSCAPRLGLSQRCYILGPASTGKEFSESPLECATLLQVCWLARASWRRGTTCSGARRSALVCVSWLRRRQPRTPGLRAVRVPLPLPFPPCRTCPDCMHVRACNTPRARNHTVLCALHPPCSTCIALFINLAEHEPSWRHQLRDLQLPDPAAGAMGGAARVQLVPLLCALLAKVATPPGAKPGDATSKGKAGCWVYPLLG